MSVAEAGAADGGEQSPGLSSGAKRLFAVGPERPGTVLCDGAMGTMLYARGVFINRCYDELNLSQPDLVRAVHARVSAGWGGGD